MLAPVRSGLVCELRYSPIGIIYSCGELDVTMTCERKRDPLC